MQFKSFAIVSISISLGLMLTNTTLLPGNTFNQVHAEANCDKAGGAENGQGNYRGNPKQCSGLSQTEGPKEPVRDCGHSNSFKDNDGDGTPACKSRPN